MSKKHPHDSNQQAAPPTRLDPTQLARDVIRYFVKITTPVPHRFPQDFGPLDEIAPVFHLDTHIWKHILTPGEQIDTIEEMQRAILPFDAFEIRLNDPMTMPFIDNPGESYTCIRNGIIALPETTQGHTFFLLDLIEHPKTGPVTNLVQFNVAPSGDASMTNLSAPTIIGSELPRTDQHYWLSIFCGFMRFASLLAHQATGIELFDDPKRPRSRHERRQRGYVDRDHYRIILRAKTRPGQTHELQRKLNDVTAGRHMRYTPRRRHLVTDYSYHKPSLGGRLISVPSHERGGKILCHSAYDARKLILDAAADRRASSQPPSHTSNDQ